MFGNIFVPETTPNDLRGVAALLALIGNPESKAALDLLAKLSAEKDAAVEAGQTAAADRAAAEANHAEAKKLHADITGRLAELTAEADARHTALAAREDELTGREVKVANLAHDVEQTSSAHLDRVARDTNGLAAREQRIADREAELDKREAALKDAEADYAARIGKLRALAG